MRRILLVLLVLAVPTFAYDYRQLRFRQNRGARLDPAIRYGNTYYGSSRDQSWRLDRVRRPQAHPDPYSYGRCYWRGYYRPYLYCRQYTPRYSYYSATARRYPQPHGLRGPSYPGAYARPPHAYGCSVYGYGGYGGVYQSRYGYRYPAAYTCGGAGPYGFTDPWGYRLLPAFDFAPILTRLTTVFTIDDPAFDGEETENADGLPQPRTKPVGARFLVPEK